MKHRVEIDALVKGRAIGTRVRVLRVSGDRGSSWFMTPTRVQWTERGVHAVADGERFVWWDPTTAEMIEEELGPREQDEEARDDDDDSDSESVEPPSCALPLFATTADGLSSITVLGMPHGLAGRDLRRETETKLRVSDTASGAVLFEIEGALPLALSADGRYLAGVMLGSGDAPAPRIWSLVDGRELASWQAKKGWPVDSMAFSPDGLRVAVHFADDALELRETSNGEQVFRREPRVPRANEASMPFWQPYGMTFGSAVIVTVAAGGFGVAGWAADDGRPLWNVASAYLLHPYLVASPDGRRVLVGGPGYLAPSDAAVTWPMVIDVETGAVAARAARPGGTIVALASSEHWLAAGEDRGGLRVITKSGESSLPAHTRTTNLLTAMTNGELLSASLDGTVRRWNLTTNQASVVECLADMSPFEALAVSDDGSLALILEGRTAVLKDLHTGSTRWRVENRGDHLARPRALGSRPVAGDRVWIAGLLDTNQHIARVISLELDDGRVSYVIGEPTGPPPGKPSFWARLFGGSKAQVRAKAFAVYGLARQADAAVLLGASTSLATIALPDAAPLATWDGIHPSSDTTIAWSSDGSRLAAWRHDHVADDLHLLSADGRLEERIVIERRGDAVSALAWGADGTTLMLGTARGVVIELAVP